MRFIPVGQVAAAHGLKGEVRFRYYNEDETASLRYPSFFVDDKGAKIQLRPEKLSLRKKRFIVRFQGLETADDVRFLVGKEIFVREDDLPPLGEGEYYEYQLIGLSAVTEDGRKVGIVREIMHTKASDILVIAGRRDALIPMTEDHIAKIDRDNGFICVREEGLVE
jgi:16S rRNA processing protein RimM